jgi:ATP-dependent 26S proteasome regulatory subunit
MQLVEHTIVRLLREELQLLQEPGSYVGEVVKVMGKNKVLVKVQPEGKYSEHLWSALLQSGSSKQFILLSSCGY